MTVKIFISCVTDEFRAYRDRLATDLRRHNVEVIVQEDFKDSGWATVANDDVYIRACDVAVHLVGDMTGYIATPASTRAILTNYPDIADKLPPLRDLLEQGEAISYTQWEAWLALYHEKRLLIAQPTDGAPRLETEFAPTEESRAAQQAHLARLRVVDRHPGCTFISADQLVKYVFTAILDLLAEDQRRHPSPLHQLPADIADFAGREAQMEQLLKVLSTPCGHVSISAIDGMGGLGKTALAVHAAHRLTARYPDGQIVVDMVGTSAAPCRQRRGWRGSSGRSSR